jgi:hypothetical protein
LAAAGESVVRELLKSAQADGRGAIRTRNSTDLAAAGESVVREYLKRALITSDARISVMQRA